MQLNNYGQIVLERLHWLAERYKYVLIHSHIIMPNHVHAIIEIDSLLIPDVGIKIKSLSELVGAFKSTSSKLIHDAGLLDYKWKRSFHDTIIKDDKAFKNISNYIINNASNWKSDSLNSTL
jgi:REP element-mobilizing transposase RayT